jgi:hypothetical protein
MLGTALCRHKRANLILHACIAAVDSQTLQGTGRHLVEEKALSHEWFEVPLPCRTLNRCPSGAESRMAPIVQKVVHHVHVIIIQT